MQSQSSHKIFDQNHRHKILSEEMEKYSSKTSIQSQENLQNEINNLLTFMQDFQQETEEEENIFIKDNISNSISNTVKSQKNNDFTSEMIESIRSFWQQKEEFFKKEFSYNEYNFFILRLILNQKFDLHLSRRYIEFKKQLNEIKFIDTKIRNDHQINFIFKKLVYRFRIQKFKGQQSLLREFYQYYFQDVLALIQFEQVFFMQGKNRIKYKKQQQVFKILKMSENFIEDLKVLERDSISKQVLKIDNFFQALLKNIMKIQEYHKDINKEEEIANFLFQKRHLFPRSIVELQKAFDLFYLELSNKQFKQIFTDLILRIRFILIAQKPSQKILQLPFLEFSQIFINNQKVFRVFILQIQLIKKKNQISIVFPL